MITLHELSKLLVFWTWFATPGVVDRTTVIGQFDDRAPGFDSGMVIATAKLTPTAIDARQVIHFQGYARSLNDGNGCFCVYLNKAPVSVLMRPLTSGKFQPVMLRLDFPAESTQAYDVTVRMWCDPHVGAIEFLHPFEEPTLFVGEKKKDAR